MNRYRISMILLCIFILQFGLTARSQIADVQLRMGERIEKELSAGQIHAYCTEIPSGKFFLAVVDQRGIDVTVKIYSPDGQLMEEVDSPNGTQGPEPIALTTEESGKYRFEVTPLNADAETGRYEIRIVKVKPAATTLEGRVDQLMALWDRPDSPGAALSVIRDGEIVYKKGYGSAQLEYDIPITSSTIFHVASVSKQFTAFAAAMLADQGKLSLDDDIRKYLPNLPDFGKTITIRHLIHHSSGLRDQWNLLVMAGWRMDDVITKAHILELMRHQRELNFDPNDEMVYCNTGYTLLAEIVEKVTTKSFREWTYENMFKPLVMNHTHFHDDHQMIVPNRAYSYSSGEDGGYRKSVLNYANVGATSLFTTVEDLAKWTTNFETGEVGGKDVIDQVHQRLVVNSGDTLGYGFGLGIGRYRGLRTVAHSGGDAGFRSYLIRFPDQRFAVAVLSNMGGFNPSGIARRIADIYLEQVMVDEEESPSSESEAREVTVSVEILDKYAGSYQITPWRLLTVVREGDHLSMMENNGSKSRMKAVSDSTFVVSTTGGRVIFSQPEEGRSQRLTYRGQEGNRITAFKPDENDLQAYTGDYYSEELGTTYTIRMGDKTLIVRHRKHGEGTLTPTIKDHFICSFWWLRNMQFIRNDEKGLYGMRVSNGRVRNLWFEKIKSVIQE
jgi:CubicO group peptidase (beta-lactamase class C family)